VEPRRPPAEDAVREQLREEEERVAPAKEDSRQSTVDSRQDEGSDPARGSGPEPAPDAEPEAAPEDPLTIAERERDEYLALAQRAQADFENFRKRAAREAAAATQRAKSGLVGELLPVVDNLERALGSASEADEHLAGGVKLVHSELVAVLNRNGVEQFDPAGEKFDPAVHEALSTREDDGADAGVVLDVVEKGYRLNGNVLRPARVVVSG